MGFTSRKIDFKMWGSGVRHLLVRLNETRPVYRPNLPKKLRIPKRRKMFDVSRRYFQNIITILC